VVLAYEVLENATAVGVEPVGTPDPGWVGVLKSERRDFSMCVSGKKDPRAALCLFDSREAAERHLQDISEPKLYLHTFERYGTGIPGWMNDDWSLLPASVLPTRDHARADRRGAGDNRRGVRGPK
jgi:hypothetical protein